MNITLEQLEAAMTALARNPKFQGAEVQLHNVRLLRMLGKPLTAAEELAIATIHRRARAATSFVIVRSDRT